MEGVDGEVESMMIATTPSSRDVKTRKRKREVEGWGSPSVDAVSEGNLRETVPSFWLDARRRHTRTARSSGNHLK